ncbi:MAG: ribosome biogenesis GTP-binding protein YihA/YsxC [Proteobacteria bacterium]|nr:ribosome biogenesis GTP-binding protein YihA/YsxC [Pseudomonadota bacterium]MCL2307529.1 ribosome biogenesis GTP-binding protein YihA/YsxC [Pseudomonadota bacterium]
MQPDDQWADEREAAQMTTPLVPPLLEAAFVTGAAQWGQLPPPAPTEIAFAGRSNAGKSSAVNALARRARLAFASRTPGRTQQINFFQMRCGAYAVDLPGYGYAAVARQTKNVWQDFLWRYVTERQTLAALVLVADIRRGITDLDKPVLEVFLRSSRPVLLLATKSDKLNVQERRRALADIDRTLREYGDAAAMVTVVEFSATARRGIEAADRIIAGWVA